MRFPWSKRRKARTRGGEQARQQAQVHHEEIQAQWPEVRRVSQSLRELRERNGFAEAIRLAMGVHDDDR